MLRCKIIFVENRPLRKIMSHAGINFVSENSRNSAGT